MVKQATIIVRVDEELKKGLEGMAKKSRRRLSDYIRLVFEDAVKEGKTV